eukprot:TRINITY_DN3463_c0_g1_i1.p1 TRINITY_DN3463_c0_g1~~TRINITY_DN3463_c0_g1_i1.p1  ORF type:complete len:493 (+),score=112.14 TRINITY_DN3463_c0_g1_i1:637-2115(+)
MTSLAFSRSTNHEALHFPKENHDGKVTDFYHLGKQLGSGSFSVVVEAVEKATNKDFAIKVVNKADTNAREMDSELSVMARLEHPNIVFFKEIFDATDAYYVVLEKVTGGELFDRIIELRRYTEQDASSVMRQALKGLRHMHERDLVHRDIKPENLLLESKAPDAVLKIADFGFASVCRGDQDLDETLGTPPYMAPEIVRLRNEDEDWPGYGKAVDIWALGVCFYILLSGVHPFQIPDEEEMLQNIEDGRWTWKGNNWSNVSEEAKKMIMAMMCPNPQRRWTAQQCLDSKWITGHCPDDELASIQDTIKQYQARKKLKGAIFGVMATNSLVKLSHLRAQQQGGGGPAKPLAATKVEAPRPERLKNFEALKIRIIRGEELAARNSNGKSDPYLKFWCGQYKYKSKKKMNTLHPEWDETIKPIPSALCTTKIIEVECWDWDLIGSDNFMGQFVIEPSVIAKLAVDVTETMVFSLAPKLKSKKKVSGSIILELTKL